MDGAPFGQPVVLNAQGKRTARKMEKYRESMFDKLHKIHEQEKRVEKLEERQYRKENGLTNSGGLAKSVENIERWENRIIEQEQKKWQLYLQTLKKL